MKPSTRAHIVVCHVAKETGTRSHQAYSLEERKHNFNAAYNIRSLHHSKPVVHYYCLPGTVGMPYSKSD